MLPSPNGSTISHHLAQRNGRVLAACLRNRQAVVDRITAQIDVRRLGRTVAVIPAGEQRSNGALRPAVEDLWGGGAVVDALVGAGWDHISPEAREAAAAYRDIAPDLHAAMPTCGSGREMIADGWEADVRIAAELDTSSSVPSLDQGAFTRAAI